MSVAESRGEPVATEHALLVPLGRFAEQIGLLAALQTVPFPMKTVTHSPGDKLTQLLAHLLAGGMHIDELDTSPHPLRRDAAVVQAWGQTAVASASGVSGLLRAATDASVAGVVEAAERVLAPYRQRVLREGGEPYLVVDCDLTGLVVSDQAMTYEGAEYGYMGEVGGVAKGYQFARAQVASAAGAWVLGGFLHGGRTVSVTCLAELVTLIEQRLGRPRRRVEAVAARLAQTEAALAAWQADAAPAGGPRSGRTPRQQQRWEREGARLTAEAAQLRETLQRLRADNATNPAPVRIVLRLDGGFGDAASVAWLWEQGYEFVVRAHSAQVAARLRTEPDLGWVKISQNAHLAACAATTVGTCPYPLRLFVARQWRGAERPERWSALIVSPSLPVADWPTRRVGRFYNGRQTIEAGIKESKQFFASRHLPTRHQPGIALYEALVLLAQNLLRWFRPAVLADTRLARVGTKALVRSAAHCRALVAAGGSSLHFAADSPWAGVTLWLQRPLVFQLWFAFLDDVPVASSGP